MIGRSLLRRAVVVLAPAILVLLSSPAGAQISDTTPPTLSALTFTPDSVDVTGAPGLVVITATVQDDLAGTSLVQAQFRSPSGLRSLPTTTLLFMPRIGGTALNGVYRGTLPIPRFVEGGDWHLQLTLRDTTNNVATLTAATIQALGFPTVLSVASIPDLTAPTVAALSIAPVVLDVSAGPARLTTTLTLADDVSGNDMLGFAEFRVTYRSPSGRQDQYAARQDFIRVSGDNLLGTWTVSTEFQQFAEAGNWSLAFLQTLDTAGNRRTFSAAMLRSMGFNPDFTIASPVQDLVPPSISGLSFSPAVIDASASAQVVTVTMRLADGLSGVSFTPDHPNASFVHGVQFTSPSGGQVIQLANGQFQLTGGTVQNGIWSGPVFFPRFSEGGTWSASLLSIKDKVNNRFGLSKAQLDAAGLQSSLVVFRPSLDSDGTIGIGGGTVDDTVFGSRASLTVPVGVLAQDTSIAIDVLSGSLGLPTPAGFSGGTLFVNVNLVPKPRMPLPAPGLSLTLPLTSFRAPGAPVNLYRLDPGTGLLIPAVGIGGVRVVGTVDAGGLSASFSGVTRLSTVVGFFPTAVVGDVDGNELVDCADLLLVRSAFGKRLNQAGFDSRADINRNGVIDINDLAVVSRELPAGVSCN